MAVIWRGVLNYAHTSPTAHGIVLVCTARAVGLQPAERTAALRIYVPVGRCIDDGDDVLKLLRLIYVYIAHLENLTRPFLPIGKKASS